MCLLVQFGICIQLLTLAEWQRKREAASLADFALHRNRTAVRLDQALRDREAKTGAAISLRRAGLVELLEDGCQLVRRDAHSGIPDGHIGESVVPPRRDRHLAATRRKLQCVAGKIVENLTKALAIGEYLEAREEHR